MKVTKAPLEGLYIIELQVFKDNRGFFVERFNQQKFLLNDLPVNFVQDNHSRSNPKVLRGVHAQTDQGKLVGVLKGKIFDIAVDIRPNSPSFGEYFSIELSDENGKLLWIPAGFAHGFCVLGNDEVDVLYKVDAPYNPEKEFGIKWDDQELGIEWPEKTPLLSDRDLNLPSFADYKSKMKDLWK